MKEFLKHNRTAAWIALVVCILAALTLGTYRTVQSAKSSLESAFTADDSQYGCVRQDLEDYAQNATQLYAIAKANGCASEEFYLALSEFQSTEDTPTGSVKALETLSSQASLAYNQIASGTTVLEENEKNSAILYFYEMQSIEEILSNNKTYRNAAVKYNKIISSFPASLFSGSMGEAKQF